MVTVLNGIIIVIFLESQGLFVCVFVCVSHLLKVVHQSAHKLSKNPTGQWVQGGSERHTADQKQDISCSQVH